MRRLPWLAASTLLLIILASVGLYAISNHGWVRANSLASVGAAVARQMPQADNRGHLYVLDGWGGVHPAGSAPALAGSAAWPNKDIAFSLALFPDSSGGYVMDGYGGLHAVGSAPSVESGVLWPHWIGAREVVMAPWASASSPAGYLLDADGGIHPFGGAPSVSGFATWPALGIARGLVLLGSSTPGAVAGYTLDGFGGVHPFGGARRWWAPRHFRVMSRAGWC